MTGPNVAVPITKGEFDQFVLSRPYFEAGALQVAVNTQTNTIQGFVHCGFGPDEPGKFCMSLDREMGTLAIICGPPDAALSSLLIQAGVSYLKSAGAKVVYAGGRFPLNPFYWGLYGGSEFAGVLDSQSQLYDVLAASGFQECGGSTLLEFDLASPTLRHIKNAILRRECRVNLYEEKAFECQWTELALENFLPLSLELNDKLTNTPIASASLWPMSLYGRRTGQARIGLIDVSVTPGHRRKGFGRLLLSESVKHATDLSYDVMCVQTDATNTTAVSFYENSGFAKVGSTRLFRLTSV